MQMILEEIDSSYSDLSNDDPSSDGHSVNSLAYHEACNELIAYKEALDQNTIVSITSKSGVITYANEKF